MPAVNLSWSAARWSNQVQDMVAQLGVQEADFLKQELVLLVNKIIAFTPPQSKAQGVARTKSDIGKLVRPFDVSSFRNPRLERICDAHDYAAFNRFFQYATGPLHDATAIDAYDVPDYHARSRNNRGGVNGKFRNVFVIGATEIKFLADYVKRETSNVGMARAGWLPALRAVGGLSAVSDLAGWSRNTAEYGSYTSNLDDPERPYLDAINSSPWAAQGDTRTILNAMDSRTEALKGRLAFLARYVRDHAGLAAA